MPTSLGLSLDGGMLPTVPPNAPSSSQIAVINDIINHLNTWNGVIVQQGEITISNNGATTSISTIPHNLGYKPVVFAFLNHMDLSSLGLGSDVFMPLPTWTVASVSGGNVLFQTHLSVTVDNTQIGVVWLNGTGVAKSYTMTYYLARLH